MNVINAKKEEENAKAVREKIASEKENVTLQLSDGTIHDSRQARIIINKITEELKSNNSMDLRRKLAEAYMVAKEVRQCDRAAGAGGKGARHVGPCAGQGDRTGLCGEI